MDDEDLDEKQRPDHVLEFIRDIVSLGPNIAILHEMIPGGMRTLKKAMEDGFVIIVKQTRDYNCYGLTFNGLLNFWDKDNPENKTLISYKTQETPLQ